MSEVDEKAIFATAVSADGKPLIVIGIPQGLWEHIKNGETNVHFDFSNAGIEVQLVMFGGPDHQSVLKTVQDLCTVEDVAKVSAGSPKWRLIGHDPFDGGDYELSEHETDFEALAAARERLRVLNLLQPPETSGGQSVDGIQDRVFILSPDGIRTRIIEAT